MILRKSRLPGFSFSEKLANSLRDRGELTEAEELYKRSVALKEKAGVLGAETVAQRLNRAGNLARSHANLAALYRSKGLTSEAESHARRAMEIREEHLGKVHPDLAGSLEQLGYLAEDRGEFAKAEALFARATAIRTQAFKPDEAGVTSNHAERGSELKTKGTGASKTRSQSPLF